jgi:AraC-like DNA-binding protein
MSVLSNPERALFVTDFWSAEALAPHRQFEAWRELIVDAHMRWDIPDIACDAFPAFMRQHRAGGLRLTDCTAPSPVSGKRGRPQITQDGDGNHLTVVLVAQGVEALTFHDGREVLLKPGMFTIWDSGRPLSFATGEHLRQMSLLIPEDALLRRMPRVRDMVGRPIDARSGLAGLFVDHLQSLIARFGELPAASRDKVLDGTLDLLCLSLGAQAALPPPRLRQVVLDQMKQHIERHLTDRSLGVGMLAKTFRMTDRNVHKLFEQAGTTVGAHIRSRRLAMCKRDLEASALAARHVSEIAKHWGFEDPSHFSKAFRSTFGVSPSDCRKAARTDARPTHRAAR